MRGREPGSARACLTPAQRSWTSQDGREFLACQKLISKANSPVSRADRV